MVEQTVETRAWKALRGIEPEWEMCRQCADKRVDSNNNNKHLFQHD
jgi:hypothetical protein